MDARYLSYSGEEGRARSDHTPIMSEKDDDGGRNQLLQRLASIKQIAKRDFSQLLINIATTGVYI